MAKYQCPVCKVIANIDKEKKKVDIFLPSATRIFPAHACELAKPVDSIKLDQLIPLEKAK